MDLFCEIRLVVCVPSHYYFFFLCAELLEKFLYHPKNLQGREVRCTDGRRGNISKVCKVSGWVRWPKFSPQCSSAREMRRTRKETEIDPRKWKRERKAQAGFREQFLDSIFFIFLYNLEETKIREGAFTSNSDSCVFFFHLHLIAFSPSTTSSVKSHFPLEFVLTVTALFKSNELFRILPLTSFQTSLCKCGGS